MVGHQNKCYYRTTYSPFNNGLRWVVAFAWLLSQGEDILPIPGMKRRSHLQDNLGALKIQLTPDDLAQLSTLSESVQGQRHYPYDLKFIEDS